mmetsp:Transcript_33225/g.94140  ORF Transcript_33225/g.94140 Transcript_33225/m.94140 type:complete len:135 (-) Transcript_33225:161-565(-)
MAVPGSRSARAMAQTLLVSAAQKLRMLRGLPQAAPAAAWEPTAAGSGGPPRAASPPEQLQHRRLSSQACPSLLHYPASRFPTHQSWRLLSTFQLDHSRRHAPPPLDWERKRRRLLDTLKAVQATDGDARPNEAS